MEVTFISNYSQDERRIRLFSEFLEPVLKLIEGILGSGVVN